MSEQIVQRRKYPRIPSKNAVLVKQLDGEAEGFTKTHVVGLGGFMFMSDVSFGSGAYLDVLIAVKQSVVKAFCKVAYERKNPDATYEVGVEFIQISDTDRKLIETLWAGAIDPNAVGEEWA